MSHSLTTISHWAVFLMIAVLVPHAAESAGPPSTPPSRAVVVHLVSGRVLTGDLDARTNEADLWLQWRRGTITLGRPIQWEHISRVELSGQTFSGEAVRQAVVDLRRELPGLDPSRHKVISLVGATEVSSPVTSPETVAIESAASDSRVDAGVASLAIHAEVDNWDADAAPDGLVVEVCPRDAEGRATPVSGVLDVELIAPSPNHRDEAVLLERWTQRIDAGDYSPAGATCRLPFDRFDPPRDAATHGEVRARLMVPGEGVLEATAPMVRIRPYHVVRAAAR
jgi:hypothetical protein